MLRSTTFCRAPVDQQQHRQRVSKSVTGTSILNINHHRALSQTFTWGGWTERTGDYWSDRTIRSESNAHAREVKRLPGVHFFYVCFSFFSRIAKIGEKVCPWAMNGINLAREFYPSGEFRRLLMLLDDGLIDATVSTGKKKTLRERIMASSERICVQIFYLSTRDKLLLLLLWRELYKYYSVQKSIHMIYNSHCEPLVNPEYHPTVCVMVEALRFLYPTRTSMWRGLIHLISYIIHSGVEKWGSGIIPASSNRCDGACIAATTMRKKKTRGNKLIQLSFDAVSFNFLIQL